MDEDITILTDEELVNTFSDNAFKLYMRDISKYPILSSEDQKELAIKYQTGDYKARELLINSNLRLVVSVANHYRNIIKHLDILDIIQEGNMGLMRAVEDYDPEKGAFSTYAVWWIKQGITRAIADKDSTIRKPVHLIEAIRRYKKLINDNNSCGKKLSDEEICTALNISKETLKNIRDAINQTPVSIDQTVDDDSETELSNFLPSTETGYDDVLNRMVNDTLLVTLKEVLSPLHYFIIYYRILSGEDYTLEQTASYFNLTRERIRQLESKALKKLRIYMNHNSTKMTSTYNNIAKREGLRVNRLKKEPLHPDKIIEYLYLQPDLEYLEERILYLKVFSKYNYNLEELAYELNVSVADIKNAYQSLRNKLQTKFKNQEKYQKYRLSTIKSYGTKIFDIDIPKRAKEIDYQKLITKYSSTSLDEILNLFKSIDYNLTVDEERLLAKYYGQKVRKGLKEEELLIDINITLFGFKHQDMNVPKDKLYQEYLRIKNEFNDEQQLFLETYYFCQKDKSAFKAQYPDSTLYYRYYFLIDRLERSYYHILRFFDNTFTKEMYEQLKKKYPDKLSASRIQVLDMYYGVNGKVYSISEIAETLNLDYIKAHDLCRDARDYAIKLYSGLANYRVEIKPNIYKKYITNPKYYFVKETREILDMFIIQGLSYDEISTKTGLNKTRISNIITDAIRKMDNYRFGLTTTSNIPKTKLKEFLKNYQNNLTKEEAKIIICRYVENMMPEDIADYLNLDINIIKSALKHFNNLYESYLIKDITINDNDIKEEVDKHISESVLNDPEKELISFYLGLTNRYNPSGIKLDYNGLIAKYKLTKTNYWHKYMTITRKIKSRKAGVLNPDLLYISRQELDKLLEDKHLPISPKEKEIICYLFELKGYPYKTLNELTSIFNDNKGSLKRRYQRAIVTIYKYLNKEIDSKIDYDTDIVPLLKYFAPSDRIKLEDFYKNGLSYEEIATKCHVNFHQIVSIMERIKINLYELMNNLDNTKVFDFAYYEEAIKNPDLPFYGDLDLAIKIFNLAFGMDGAERKSVPTIIQELNLDLKTSAINRVISNLMLSVCKLRDGIVKETTFSFEDIYAYYLRNHQNMSYQHKLYYLRYFNKITSSRNINGLKEDLSYYIINDLIKDIYPNAFDFSTATKEDVIALLKKYGQDLKKSTKNELMAIYDISEREFLTGKELNHLYKLLDILDTQLKLSPQERLLYRKD